MREPRSFIVRIYRQGARTLTGVIEDAQTQRQYSFSSMQQLWTLLRRRTPDSTAPRADDK